MGDHGRSPHPFPYSVVYITEPCLLAVAVSAEVDAAVNTFLLVIPASVLVSYLAYNGIEAPFMRLRGVYVQRERDEKAEAPKGEPAS